MSTQCVRIGKACGRAAFHTRQRSLAERPDRIESPRWIVRRSQEKAARLWEPPCIHCTPRRNQRPKFTTMSTQLSLPTPRRRSTRQGTPTALESSPYGARSLCPSPCRDLKGTPCGQLAARREIPTSASSISSCRGIRDVTHPQQILTSTCPRDTVIGPTRLLEYGWPLPAQRPVLLFRLQRDQLQLLPQGRQDIRPIRARSSSSRCGSGTSTIA